MINATLVMYTFRCRFLSKSPYSIVSIVEPPIDDRSDWSGTLEDPVGVVSQHRQRQEPSVRPAPDGRPLGVDVSQVVLKMLRHLDRARDFRPAEVLVDGEEPVGALEAGAHRVDDGVDHVLTAGEVRLEKNKKFQKC